MQAVHDIDVTACDSLQRPDNEQNVLDVATSAGTSSAPRPVLLFVAGESFANEGTSVDWEMRQKAICLSARNGMVGVSMSYRRALCKPTWGTRTSSTRSAIPSCRRIGSRTFGGSADASRPKCAPRDLAAETSESSCQCAVHTWPFASSRVCTTITSLSSKRTSNGRQYRPAPSRMTRSRTTRVSSLP
jgi:hypothetical protein